MTSGSACGAGCAESKAGCATCLVALANRGTRADVARMSMVTPVMLQEIKRGRAP